LKTLSCTRTQIADLAPIQNLVALQTLDCSHTQIADLAPIQNLTALQTLYCFDTQIADLAPIQNLAALRILSCSNTKITELAPIRSLAALQALYCFNTQITDLAPIQNLTALQTLNCGRTQITDLTPIQNLAGLRDLYCSGTQIADLAPIQNLVALQTLDCSHTQIADLAPIQNLAALQNLSCCGTKITNLAPLIPLIRAGLPVKLSSESWRGKGIYVEGCPLTNPPAEIVSQGNDAILNYFAEREKGGVDHLYEAKMLVLGEGGAGKTSLIRRLYHSEMEQLPREDESTKGIVVESVPVPLANGRTLRLNVWDFGGQQIYHATHQFFLTQRSLYILLDDTRKDNKSASDEGFRYWLELIELFGGHSPTLIFQNEKGGRSKAIDLAGIKKQYDNVKERYAGNLELGGSADKLRDDIPFYAGHLPQIGEELPASWIKIRAGIENLARGRHSIPVEEYLALCAPHLGGDEKRAFFLSSYLHDLGVFLHFQDDPVLRKTVILKNEWATTAVFRILDDETVKANLGRFTEENCARLWEGSAYAKSHLELLALMEKFELCYKLRDTKPSTWLAPQLLPPSEPGELKNWARPGDLILRYKYDFLPRGMISRLTVRLHRFVHDPEKAWVTGVLFQEPCLDDCSTDLLAEILPAGDEIELRARGPEAKKMLSVVSADLDALNDSFKGLRDKVDRRIPCNCNACKASVLPEFFAYKYLLRRKEDGRLQVECPRSYETVSVLELLDGIKVPESPEFAKGPSASRPPVPIKIFLASSSELREDRDKFDLHFRQLNDELIAEGVHLQIVRWEHFLDAMSETRLQEEYNKEIRRCDAFVSLFFTKAGKFTEEEFDVALNQFRAEGRPLIYTYFKDAPVTTGTWKKEDHDSIDALKKKLKDLGHYPTTYSNIDNLINKFRGQIPMIREKLKL
jgi:hypothetical protein